MIKTKITEVAVDAFTDYLQEKFEKLKQFDLDQDGHKDVDQVIAILKRCGVSAKAALATTDFPNIAAGLEQIIAGTKLIGSSMDQAKLSAFGQEMKVAATELSKLSQLSIKYVKDQPHKN